MELKCLAEGTSLDFGGQRRKQAAKIISTLCLADADSLDEELRENLLLELKNVFLKFMEVSRDGRGFTSLVFGMGQLSDEGVVKKSRNRSAPLHFRHPMHCTWIKNLPFYRRRHFRHFVRNTRTGNIF